MNLPNKLTILRMLLVPVFIVTLMIHPEIMTYRIIALIIFIIASLTDMLDGYIARKYDLITDFGKLMDPLADKLLVCSALICFVELNQIPSWVVILIIAREFIISGFRMIAADKGIVIAASWWGKLKTISQMITVILLIINIEQLAILEAVMIWIMTILTIISMIDYLIKNRKVLEGEM